MQAYKLVPRGPLFQVVFRDLDGKRQRISTGERDEQRANLVAAQIVNAHNARLAPTQSEDAPRTPGSRKIHSIDARRALVGVTLSAALRHAKQTVWRDQASQDGRDGHIRMLEADHGTVDIGHITYAFLVDYGIVLTKRGNSNATINRKFSTLRVALREQHDLGVLPAIPKIPQYKEAAPKDRYISALEERSQLAEIDHRIKTIKREDGVKQLRWKYFRALYVLLIDSGMRVSEALTLAPKQVRMIDVARAESGDSVPGVESVAEAWLAHGSTKNGRGRAVPLSARAHEALTYMLASPLHGRTVADDVSKMYRQVADSCGHYDTKLHTLRHTCASRLVQAGVEIYTVMYWLGHSSVEMTKRYAHLATNQPLQGALRALERANLRAVG